jgi:hypothetical protein
MGYPRPREINWMNINNLLIKEDLTPEILEKMENKSCRAIASGFGGDYGPPKCNHFDDNQDGYCDCCDIELE